MVGTAAGNTNCLHLVVGPGDRALEDCLAQARPGDTIVFLDAGVQHVIAPGISKAGWMAHDCRFAAVDLEAHGLLAGARAAGVTIFEDAEFCKLLSEHAHCLTWT